MELGHCAPITECQSGRRPLFSESSESMLTATPSTGKSAKPSRMDTFAEATGYCTLATAPSQKLPIGDRRTEPALAQIRNLDEEYDVPTPSPAKKAFKRPCLKRKLCSFNFLKSREDAILIGEEDEECPSELEHSQIDLDEEPQSPSVMDEEECLPSDELRLPLKRRNLLQSHAAQKLTGSQLSLKRFCSDQSGLLMGSSLSLPTRPTVVF